MFDKIRVSSLAITLGVALLGVAALPQLRASELDKKTVVTFNAPVELSGQILPAGTYIFKTLGDDNNVVIVTNLDENHSYGIFNTIPIETLAVPDGARIELSEDPVSAPEAVHAWFYPGVNYGWEFPAATARKQAAAERAD